MMIRKVKAWAICTGEKTRGNDNIIDKVLFGPHGLLTSLDEGYVYATYRTRDDARVVLSKLRCEPYFGWYPKAKIVKVEISTKIIK